ncbi:MAG: YbjQ family protein [Candidatus Marsarchaeota archaeon]|nr:YbjQ family protein [Candidatus Marsarchaeota archaeon]
MSAGNATVDSSVFTSDLSTSDFWMLLDRGYMPIGLVVGNSVYSMGFVGGLGSSLKGMTKGEIPQITELMYNAREMAIGRMKEEAAKMGADGVVEVKLNVIPMGNWMEITAIGTAIKYVGKSKSSGSGSPTVVLPVDK